jgi:hypothetical protein
MSLEPHFIKILGKCDDRFSMRFLDNHLNELGIYQGYVPSWVGIGGGDYIKLTIDVNTGQIVGWNEELAREIRELHKNNEAEREAREITTALNPR